MRKPDHVKRKSFSKAIKAEVLKRSGQFCEMEGCENVGAEFDHITPVAFGGESTLENCRLLCRKCNRDAGIETARRAAKCDRQGGRAGQYARRKNAVKQEGKPRKTIQSRGFQGSRRFNGEINWKNRES